MEKLYYVKKNYNDVFGGIIYSLGCSLVHIVMLIGILIVKEPDCQQAKKLDRMYEELSLAVNVDNNLF